MPRPAARPPRKSIARPPRGSDPRTQVRTILTRLRRAHPDARLALDYSSPFELLIALILAAQCTDERVNELTRTVVFHKYRTPED